MQKQRRLGVLWLIPLGVVLWALVCNYSRAGILLFFGGITVWLIWMGLRSSHRKPAIIGINIVLLLFLIFFTFGGETLDRFKRETLTPFASGQDLRTLLHRDAWTLSIGAPLFGIGLGNFAPVFAMARTASAQQNFALHPESDWLWTAVELGWLAPICILGALLLWLIRCFPLERGTQSGLRSALSLLSSPSRFTRFTM
ncbi:MAG: O-antigen ligase family protein [Bryobacteraceae bacterium]|nr:O-antigen ligase family protein [Bryobacteraceae bacterium]